MTWIIAPFPVLGTFFEALFDKQHCINFFLDVGVSIRRNRGSQSPKATALGDIPHSTAYELINEFNASYDTVLLGSKNQAFPGLGIPISGLYKHIREKCILSLKQATK
ncbi:uncharacterized protein EV154DRAFT_477313 [Mucor mucedo]|uniref:uncharacterized protein n=1 Tax=Mucor mucedo TaxID=29922 RepID=UPI00221FA93F|nr:uncharacterized protein EV154DRAFT_477313 [Mucor mucedo]KAI7895515.1 hypothetical protein EV154DRAFT_477313 [Mucor mucedo]